MIVNVDRVYTMCIVYNAKRIINHILHMKTLRLQAQSDILGATGYGIPI